MPWTVQKLGKQFAVVKKSDGSVVAKHRTRKQALNQVAAMYANTKEKY